MYVAEEVIRFGQEVASHHVVAMINHISMFTALAQAAMDEQRIVVPNRGAGQIEYCFKCKSTPHMSDLITLIFIFQLYYIT